MVSAVCICIFCWHCLQHLEVYFGFYANRTQLATAEHPVVSPHYLYDFLSIIFLVSTTNCASFTRHSSHSNANRCHWKGMGGRQAVRLTSWRYRPEPCYLTLSIVICAIVYWAKPNNFKTPLLALIALWFPISLGTRIACPKGCLSVHRYIIFTNNWYKYWKYYWAIIVVKMGLPLICVKLGNCDLKGAINLNTYLAWLSCKLTHLSRSRINKIRTAQFESLQWDKPYRCCVKIRTQPGQLVLQR